MDFSYIRQALQLCQHEEWGPYITFVDYEHFDYIDDVLTEIFELEYSFRIENDDGSESIYFEDKISFENLSNVIAQINTFHREHNREFPLADYRV